MDADSFFLEQDKRMGLPSDDFEHIEGIVAMSSERLGGILTNPAAQPTHVLPTNTTVSADSAPLQPCSHEPAAPKSDIAPHMAETSSSHSLPASGPKTAELQQHEHYESIAPAVDSSPAILNRIAGASRSFNEPCRSPAEGQCNLIISHLINSPPSSLSVSPPKVGCSLHPDLSHDLMFQEQLQTHLPQSDMNEPAPTDQMVAVSPGNIMEEPATSIEEISSFTPTPRRKKRPIDTLQASREGSDDQSTAQTKGLLSPKKRRISVSKPTKTVIFIPDRNDPNDPPTSPIEDPDSSFTSAAIEGADSRAVTSLKAAPSKLYLQVKERVATHAASKGKVKPVKLAPGARQVAPITLKDVSTIDPSSSPVSHHSRSSPPTTANASANTKAKMRVKAEKSNNKLAKGKQKEEQKLTPMEYAQRARERPVSGNGSKQTSTVKFLDGLNVFYVGGDLHFASQRTRGRMDIIVKYGGNLLPTYDAVLTTHIVTDAGARPTLRALGLKKLSDIPDHIPTVKWSWVISGIGRSPSLSKDGLKVQMDQTWMHTAFVQRIDAGVEPAPSSKGKNKVAESADISDISMFTQDKDKSGDHVKVFYDSEDDDERNSQTSTSAQPRYPQQPREFPPTTNSAGAPKSRAHDPLSVFYPQARAQLDQKGSRHGEAEDSDTSSDDEIQDPLPRKSQPKRGWTCDSKEPQAIRVPNQDIINKLEELKTLHQAKPSDDDRWRVFSYTKCIRALRNYPKRIESFAEARAIRGVGDKTAAKIMEILETGNLRRIDYENTEDVKVTRLFNGIYGVGQSTAYKWYTAGCRTLQDILDGKNGVTLSAAQEIGIRYYEDINDRMPREEAKMIFDLIKPIALSIDSQLFIDIMGSYRRGKADCGDIDILITRPTDDGRTHLGVLPRLLNTLHAAGILTEDLAVPEDFNELEAVYRGLCHVPRSGSRRRRIDFLTVPWKSRGAALLYYTGDDIFNRAIRLKADSMGYSLNQRGLFAGIIRDPRDRRVKLNSGNLVASETEEEIFKILNVPWQEPHERVRG